MYLTPMHTTHTHCCDACGETYNRITRIQHRFCGMLWLGKQVIRPRKQGAFAVTRKWALQGMWYSLRYGGENVS